VTRRAAPTAPAALPVPPADLDYVHHGRHYLEFGERFAGYCRDLAALPVDGAVLDLGCGFGRLAVGLAGRLGIAGRYEGLDVVPAAIDWCRREISPLWPECRFHLLDVANSEYNPGGALDPLAVRLPFDNAGFDLVFLRSVFTHMEPPEVEHYLAEAARLLPPGGRLLASLFLLDAEAERWMAGGGAALSFPHRHGTWRTDRPGRRRAVAHDAAWVRERLAAAGFEPPAVYPGSWPGRPSRWDSQDVVVAVRAGGGRAA
jgi:SAM-dependent methyltransferase